MSTINPISGLAPLFQDKGPEKLFETTLLSPAAATPAMYDLWYSILEDALQSQDLDEEYGKLDMLLCIANICVAAEAASLSTIQY